MCIAMVNVLCKHDLGKLTVFKTTANPKNVGLWHLNFFQNAILLNFFQNAILD
jgi:hypothetical protein